MNRTQKALENMKKGYNCSQAVACAFCDITGIDENTMFAINEGFGLGMGDMNGVCGAVSGAVTILGMKNSSANPKNITKASTYKLIREFKSKFKDKNKSVYCFELKTKNNIGVPLSSCENCVKTACEILDQMLNQNDK